MLNKLTSITIALCFAVLAIAAVAPNASAEQVWVHQLTSESTDGTPFESASDYKLGWLADAYVPLFNGDEGEIPDEVTHREGISERERVPIPVDGAVTWVSDPHLLDFSMSGAWTVTLAYHVGLDTSGTAFPVSSVDAPIIPPTVRIGVYSGGQCNVLASAPALMQDLTGDSVDPTVRTGVAVVAIPAAPDTAMVLDGPDDAIFRDRAVLLEGESVCVSVTPGEDGTGPDTFVLSSLVPSTVESPTRPADLPVPNVGALVLLSIGGLMVSGVVYMRRL